MCEKTLPRIEWKYNYGLDILFNVLLRIKYCNSFFDMKTSHLFISYGEILQMILKKFPLKYALQEISQLPQGEKLVTVLTHFCNLPRKDMSVIESVCASYFIKEKEKLLLLDTLTQRDWPRQPFVVYLFSVKRGQSFVVGETSAIFENTFFIPFQKKKPFMDSVTHELIHFKVADIFEDTLLSKYQRFIAQEVAVRLLDIYLNREIGRNENIFLKKVEIAALGEL